MSNAVMAIEQGKGLVPANLAEAMELSKILADSDLAPPQYRGKPGNILVAMQYGYEIGLAPMQALQSIAVINGRPSIYGEGYWGVILKSSVYEKHAENFSGEGDAFTATVSIWRRGNPEPHVGTFSIGDAKRSGLLAKDTYQKHPKDMLLWRARHRAGQAGFSDILRGLIPNEISEDYDVTETTVKDAPAQTVAARVAERATKALPTQAPAVATSHIGISHTLGAAVEVFGAENVRVLEVEKDTKGAGSGKPKDEAVPSPQGPVGEKQGGVTPPESQASPPAAAPNPAPASTPPQTPTEAKKNHRESIAKRVYAVVDKEWGTDPGTHEIWAGYVLALASTFKTSDGTTYFGVKTLVKVSEKAAGPICNRLEKAMKDEHPVAELERQTIEAGLRKEELEKWKSEPQAKWDESGKPIVPTEEAPF